MRPKAVTVALLTMLSSCFVSRGAAAFEDQWHLGAGLGAMNASPSAIGLGLGANLYGAYGLSDMFDMRLDLAATSHPLELAGSSERHNAYTASLGVTYKIDIIEWIPYFGGHDGVMSFDIPEVLGIETRDVLFGGSIGLDYAVTRSFGLGVANRLHIPLGGASLVDVFLRAEYRFGW
jgi:hypothetical protein